MTDFWDDAPMLIIALMMEAGSTSETSVIFYETARRDIPQDSHLHTRCRENMKSPTHVSFVTQLMFCHLSVCIGNYQETVNVDDPQPVFEPAKFRAKQILRLQ
jgi:hypothetical protein